ncbi:hypothetical protein PCE1_003472 [Barthelona sp. PCE]
MVLQNQTEFVSISFFLFSSVVMDFTLDLSFSEPKKPKEEVSMDLGLSLEVAPVEKPKVSRKAAQRSSKSKSKPKSKVVAKPKRKKRVKKFQDEIPDDLHSSDFVNFHILLTKAKPDANSRPLFVRHSIQEQVITVLCETFSPLYPAAKELLSLCAEPESRPLSIHKYVMSRESLMTFASLGYTAEDLISSLELLSKTPVDDSVVKFIRASTALCRVLHYGDHIYLAVPTTHHHDVAQWMEQQGMSLVFMDETTPIIVRGYFLVESINEIPFPFKEFLLRSHLFTSDIPKETLGLPKLHILIEYWSRDFSAKLGKNIRLPRLNIDFGDRDPLREHQITSLRKIFSRERARSGVVVLPCGSGKTLLGIATLCTLKAPTIIVCRRTLAVNQWKREIGYWTTYEQGLDPTSSKQPIVLTLTADTKLEELQLLESPIASTNGVILISTYSMMTGSTKVEKMSQSRRLVMDYINSNEWGITLLDEVHSAVAKQFANVFKINSRFRLGLTATPVREDDSMALLPRLCGPTLYFAEWLRLAAKGFIANLSLRRVLVDMDIPTYREYFSQPTKRLLLPQCHSQKLHVAKTLVEYHEQRGDQILVFFEFIAPLLFFAREYMADKYAEQVIYGKTDKQRREELLQQFRNGEIQTIIISNVGDDSIDLPDANVCIQMSGKFGSRMQEAQRIGRIMRPKKKKASFYSVITRGTSEERFFANRASFIMQQGYAYSTVTGNDIFKMCGVSGFIPQTVSQKIYTRVMQMTNSSDSSRGASTRTTNSRSRLSSLSGRNLKGPSSGQLWV